MKSAISRVSLSVRERSALKLLGVSTVGDFVQLDLQKVLRLRGFGVITYVNLTKSRAKLHGVLSSEDGGGNDTLRMGSVDDGDIEDLDLTIRGLKALHRLEVKTVREFLFMDLANIDHARKCGVVTQKHLMEVQTDLRIRSGIRFPEVVDDPLLASGKFPQDKAAVRKIIKQPATPRIWRALPLFSDHPIPGIGPHDLHESFHPDASIECLAMDKRLQRAIAEKDITSLGQLLLTPGAKLIDQSYFVTGPLAKTRLLVNKFLNRSWTVSPRVEIDVRTPDGFLCSLLTPIVSNERQRHILLERIGWRAEPRTLAGLAQELGVTRERIRQIEKKGLQKLYHWQSTEALKPLHDLICGMLRERTPPISLRDISKALQLLYGWDWPVHEKAIAKLLPAFSDLKCVEGQYVRLRSS